MRIAICDGSVAEGEKTVSLLFRYSREQRRPFYMTRYQKAQPLLYDIEDGAVFDVLVLETEISDVLGITAAQRLRDKGYAGAIVFVSNSAAYAVESYEVNALGYLLKPLSYEKLSRVLARLPAEETAFFTVQHRSQTQRLSYRDILFVESDNARCRLHCHDGAVHTVYKTLSAVEDELSDHRFLRCHQSYLVNMDYVCRADKWFTLTNGAAIPIRCHGLKAVRQAYVDYLATLGG